MVSTINIVMRSVRHLLIYIYVYFVANIFIASVQFYLFHSCLSKFGFCSFLTQFIYIIDSDCSRSLQREQRDSEHSVAAAYM